VSLERAGDCTPRKIIVTAQAEQNSAY